jgi:SAM-dependent methyltransferase
MDVPATYDIIGANYVELRKPDPRIAAVILEALGQARTVLNVGAGAGSYEPMDREVIAVEPSAAMVRKRRVEAASVVRATAERLPFADGSFDAAMAVLTVHHWKDKATGMREMRRVTRGPIVVLTFDPACRPWLTDYLPALVALDEAQLPPMTDYARWLGPTTIAPVPVPHDCIDGFLYAYWRRPAAYLDAHVRSGSSSFWAIGDVEAGLRRLERDLASGAWRDQYGTLLARDSLDVGYRLVMAR